MQQAFIEKVINTWGEQGERWLNQLPTLIEQLQQRWGLSPLNAASNLSYNYIGLGCDAQQQAIALKICCDKDVYTAEYQALQHFQGRGCIRLVDHSTEHAALLLEQAIPGVLLKTRLKDDFSTICQHYAAIVNSIAAIKLPPEHAFQSVASCLQTLDRVQDARVPAEFITLAQQLRKKLLATCDQNYLCHGDLHLENIIQHGQSYIAIDPKGIVGEKAFEAAAFDLISATEMQQLDSCTIQSLIQQRLQQLASCLGLTYQRLLWWVFLRLILSVLWSIEDHTDYDKQLALAVELYPLAAE